MLVRLDNRIKELESIVQEQNRRIKALEQSLAMTVALQHGIGLKSNRD